MEVECTAQGTGAPIGTVIFEDGQLVYDIRDAGRRRHQDGARRVGRCRGHADDRRDMDRAPHDGRMVRWGHRDEARPTLSTEDHGLDRVHGKRREHLRVQANQEPDNRVHDGHRGKERKSSDEGGERCAPALPPRRKTGAGIRWFADHSGLTAGPLQVGNDDPSRDAASTTLPMTHGLAG
jgi:hypothetical protein